ncbi:MAG: DUF2179 domain-containing protein [Bacteroidales bacterium]|jgi:uncharacterized protein YebE (UPF0316 family)|nr:DUF2179 domain-containing protein [Bacteroidales bacterium]
MSDLLNTQSELFALVIIPLLIFISRIIDQSIGTLRLIFVAKGFKLLAPLLGFFEVIIWVIAIGQIMQHLDNVFCYLAYGGGFAAGNYIGIYLEEKLSLGTVLIRVMPKKDTTELVSNLKEANFGVTMMDAEGSTGKIKILLSIIKRKELKQYVPIINKFNPNAFYTVEEIKSVHSGIFRTNGKSKGISGILAGITKKK